MRRISRISHPARIGTGVAALLALALGAQVALADPEDPPLDLRRGRPISVAPVRPIPPAGQAVERPTGDVVPIDPPGIGIRHPRVPERQVPTTEATAASWSDVLRRWFLARTGRLN